MNAQTIATAPPASCAPTVDWGALLHHLEQGPAPSVLTRIDWLVTMRDALDADPGVLQRRNDADHRERLYRLARYCDDVALASLFAERRISHGEATLDERVDYGLLLWRLGDVDAAFDHNRRLLLGHPHAPRPAVLHSELLAWSRTRWPFHLPAGGWGDEALRLEPLGHHHVDDFARAYHDPAIAALCCLPQFTSDDAWHTWLDHSQAFGDQMIFGVWHRYWGFIGSVSLTLSGDLGFFYYWLGEDFQGRGFGPRAATLLLKLAVTHWGLRACYAKVFLHNPASRRALDKIGFRATGVPILDNPSAEALYRWSAQDDIHDSETFASEARALFAAMGSRIRVVKPIVPPLQVTRRATHLQPAGIAP